MGSMAYGFIILPTNQSHCSDRLRSPGVLKIKDSSGTTMNKASLGITCGHVVKNLENEQRNHIFIYSVTTLYLLPNELHIQKYTYTPYARQSEIFV